MAPKQKVYKLFALDFWLGLLDLRIYSSHLVIYCRQIYSKQKNRPAVCYENVVSSAVSSIYLVVL